MRTKFSPHQFHPQFRKNISGNPKIWLIKKEDVAATKALKEEAEKKKAKEKAEKEAKEKAEREAKEKAEREAKEKAEREAKEKAAKEAAATKKKVKQSFFACKLACGIIKSIIPMYHPTLRRF